MKNRLTIQAPLLSDTCYTILAQRDPIQPKASEAFTIHFFHNLKNTIRHDDIHDS